MANVTDTTFPGGRKYVSYSGQIARTDTSAVRLFELPAGFVPAQLRVTSPAASNAGTNARISVGSSGGAGSEFVANFDVKSSGGVGQALPSSAGLLGSALGTSIIVTGIYAEAGSASSTGGPWTVWVDGFLV